MEDLAVENVTNAHSPPATVQSVDEMHPSDPAEPEFEDAACISPPEEVVDVRFRSPKPAEGEEVNVFWPATSRAKSHSPLSSEYEQVPIFEAEQAVTEPHVVVHAEEDEVLASEISFLCAEHNCQVLLEGQEASVPEPATPLPQEDRDASPEPAQGGAEPDDSSVKEEVDPDPAHVVGCDEVARCEIAMAGDQVEAAWDEVTEEAVESAGENVEAAGSGDRDVISENEFSVEIDVRRRGGRRRKRGRTSSKVQGTRLPSRKKVEEEVCFICFDGGDLVVCDRRVCPKVYHPSCVNREESYFQSKGQWSCGWHICSKCQKSASYMCFTCTYSLCKVCVNEAEFTCIRGKKGFCPSCMGTILLMETSENADENKDGVDFNDRSCWEYLFKDYWIELKGKLSMNLDEITKAKTVSKVCSLDIANEESSDDGQGASSDRSSACHNESTSKDTSRKRMKRYLRNAILDSSIKEGKTEFSAVHQENPLMIKVKKRPRKTVNEGTANDAKSQVSVCKKNYSRKKLKRKTRRASGENLLGNLDKEPTTASEDVNWASKELLAFVSHVKNGDKSILSQYDVQEILLDYIKANNLRDPRRRSQIICDKMLLALFGKSRVGHFEMLKLVESHFLTKVSSPASDENQGGDADPIEIGNEENNDLMETNRWITRKRVESKLQANFYDYAAIDSYNINLMYLRRSLMEELIDDMSTFSEKVFGSFVRIRVSAASQRQEVYRLVQVVGCGKAPEEYRTGKRMTDVMLEIINLDKKEVITIDIISNQDFTEEECKRLRQSIKFGFISRLTVGEVQEKARVLQALRHLESEKLRLTHLRDRASEKGRKKEHRECVEKLQLLSTPEEQMKRLNEVPDVHTDPKMDPSYESPEEDGDEDENKEGNPMQSTFKGRELISPRKEGSYNWSGVLKSSNNIIALGRSGHCDDFQSMELHAVLAASASEFPSPKKEDVKINVETQNTESKAPAVEPSSENKELSRELAVQLEPKLETLLAKVDPQSNANENEKLWHYKDPSGKIQGPFSMVQLRKWSKHFPSNLGIWRKSERQEDSILLTDALAGNFQKDLPEWVPGDIKPTQLVKTSETTSVVYPAHLSHPSPPIISSANIQRTTTSLSIFIEQGNNSKSDDVGVPTGQSSLGSHLGYQNTATQNEKAVRNVACTDLIANLDNKHGTGSNGITIASRQEQIVANVINSEANQQVSYQSIDLHNRPAVFPSEIDPSKKLLEQPGTIPGSILSINGNHSQPRTDLIGEVSASEGHATQKQDLAMPLNSDCCSNLSVPKPTDKLIDHSTSSTESNTVLEILPRDPSQITFENGGASDVKPTVVSNALESVSPHRSDASTFPKLAPETLQPAYTNSFTQNSGASFATSLHPVNAYDQALSQNEQPIHLVPQTVSSCNWNLPNDTMGRELSAPSLNSTTMLSGVSAGVSTSVNCNNTLLVSSDGSKSFSTPQLSNSTSTVTFQPSNMCWGTGNPEVNNPGWQMPYPYQNFNNMAAAVGNMLCGSGATNNLGWGMIAQANMNVPWGVQPNANISWGQGLTLPPQRNATSNFVWGTPQGNTILNDGCRPPAQGNVAPYPFWNAPAPAPGSGCSSQNPVRMPAPFVGNMNQNAWGIPSQGTTGAINTSGIAHENKSASWDSPKENPSNSSFRKDNFTERNIGSRNGDFRGTGSGYGSGRQSRNWMPSGNAEGSSRPPENTGICKFFGNGHCKKGASCNYIH
ncbi:zinc finger CCCH domain-containing protein 19 isoform X2 [Dendrobium catenatum]|uniref:zinc finger CCCH domain-containing protein 19 isoform X2 n=1 Tax=Dendrobium catenatum TaxID=906689 RepID=UPI0010A018D5|nr:zinc finger CCCH domain-containing protein 19 isoform X2 [Dendrobium catenatum]